MVESPINGSRCEFLFNETVLGKYSANYFVDQTNGYIFVESPHWLDEAYSSALSILDTGALQRAVSSADIVYEVLEHQSDSIRHGKGVDVSGGYGLFVRAMRDRSKNFYWSDPYAENLVARGF
ncbi:hypothetical protein [Ovoidimarina sediminis]|uniref:hypothetical protein n=1 Tax=Ovoidimarina sediminis TaxID=3079856 RepID=UPI00290DDE6A|nr:hypothetical protein [Rhodophyticola sp. MJ-SS7]MDU8946156.1 hypothetical protein [Rhodophyticola sp. MJ-SS7]